MLKNNLNDKSEFSALFFCLLFTCNLRIFMKLANCTNNVKKIYNSGWTNLTIILVVLTFWKKKYISTEIYIFNLLIIKKYKYKKYFNKYKTYLNKKVPCLVSLKTKILFSSLESALMTLLKYGLGDVKEYYLPDIAR